MAAVSPLSTSAPSTLEAILRSLAEGGDGDALDTPPPLPERPPPRGRPRVAGGAGPWTPPSSPSLLQGHARPEVSVLAELERKALEAEARLRQKEEENAALRRQIEGYHVRWLEYEIRIKSLEEAFEEQSVALQIARDAAGRAEASRRGRHSESHMKMSEETPARPRHGGHRADARRSSVGRLGAEFRQQSQALESGPAALMEPRAWQPDVPSANPVDDLKKLKSQFRAWKKDYKARLRKTKAKLDRERSHRGSCWI